MIRPRSEMKQDKIEIDLAGPEGNAMVLMAYAKRFSKQLKYTEEKTNRLIQQMMSSDYDHLLQVFEKHFGEYVILWSPDTSLDNELEEEEDFSIPKSKSNKSRPSFEIDL